MFGPADSISAHVDRTTRDRKVALQIELLY
jgi:hypothetical protein